jgi:hypothetical protein
VNPGTEVIVRMPSGYIWRGVVRRVEPDGKITVDRTDGRSASYPPETVFPTRPQPQKRS